MRRDVAEQDYNLDFLGQTTTADIVDVAEVNNNPMYGGVEDFGVQESYDGDNAADDDDDVLYGEGSELGENHEEMGDTTLDEPDDKDVKVKSYPRRRSGVKRRANENIIRNREIHPTNNRSEAESLAILRRRLENPLVTTLIEGDNLKPVLHLYLHFVWRDSFNQDFFGILTYIKNTVYPAAVLLLIEAHTGPIQIHWISTCCDVGCFQQNYVNKMNSSNGSCDNVRHLLNNLNVLSGEVKFTSLNCKHIFVTINGLDLPCRDMGTLHTDFFNVLNPTATQSTQILSFSKRVSQSSQKIFLEPVLMEWTLCQKVTAHLGAVSTTGLDETNELEMSALKYFDYIAKSTAAERKNRGNDIGRHVLPYDDALINLFANIQSRLPKKLQSSDIKGMFLLLLLFKNWCIQLLIICCYLLL
jgi:hypothetical protein